MAITTKSSTNVKPFRLLIMLPLAFCAVTRCAEIVSVLLILFSFCIFYHLAKAISSFHYQTKYFIGHTLQALCNDSSFLPFKQHHFVHKFNHFAHGSANRNLPKDCDWPPPASLACSKASYLIKVPWIKDFERQKAAGKFILILVSTIYGHTVCGIPVSSIPFLAENTELCERRRGIPKLMRSAILTDLSQLASA